MEAQNSVERENIISAMAKRNEPMSITEIAEGVSQQLQQCESSACEA